MSASDDRQEKVCVCPFTAAFLCNIVQLMCSCGTSRRHQSSSTSRSEPAELVDSQLFWFALFFLSSSEVRLACSDSVGCVTVLSMAEGTLTPVSQWKAHDFEAWISAFSYWDTQLIYSGNTAEKL